MANNAISAQEGRRPQFERQLPFRPVMVSGTDAGTLTIPGLEQRPDFMAWSDRTLRCGVCFAGLKRSPPPVRRSLSLARAEPARSWWRAPSMNAARSEDRSFLLTAPRFRKIWFESELFGHRARSFQRRKRRSSRTPARRTRRHCLSGRDHRDEPGPAGEAAACDPRNEP